MAAARLGVDAADCAVFEDSPSGGRSGVAAGAFVIAVGDQVWPVDPAHRVADLFGVSITSDAAGRLRVRSIG